MTLCWRLLMFASACRCRPEAARARDGVPELRFAARGRGAAVSVEPLPPGLARRVRDAKRLEYDIAAAVVAGLSKVGSPACRRL